MLADILLFITLGYDRREGSVNPVVVPFWVLMLIMWAFLGGGLNV